MSKACQNLGESAHVVLSEWKPEIPVVFYSPSNLKIVHFALLVVSKFCILFFSNQFQQGSDDEETLQSYIAHRRTTHTNPTRFQRQHQRHQNQTRQYPTRHRRKTHTGESPIRLVRCMSVFRRSGRVSLFVDWRFIRRRSMAVGSIGRRSNLVFCRCSVWIVGWAILKHFGVRGGMAGGEKCVGAATDWQFSTTDTRIKLKRLYP